jgi:hypothetical protein
MEQREDEKASFLWDTATATFSFLAPDTCTRTIRRTLSPSYIDSSRGAIHTRPTPHYVSRLAKAMSCADHASSVDALVALIESEPRLVLGLLSWVRQPGSVAMGQAVPGEGDPTSWLLGVSRKSLAQLLDALQHDDAVMQKLGELEHALLRGSQGGGEVDQPTRQLLEDVMQALAASEDVTMLLGLMSGSIASRLEVLKADKSIDGSINSKLLAMFGGLDLSDVARNKTFKQSCKAAALKMAASVRETVGQTIRYRVRKLGRVVVCNTVQ